MTVMPQRPRGRRNRTKGKAVVLLTALVCINAAVAQDYPVRPIRIVVGSSAGGGGDTMARLVSQGLPRVLGQPVIVDNRAGASGNIGAEIVAKAPADGYTVLLAPPGHATSPSLFPKLPFDAIRDFAAITLLSTNESILVVHPSVLAKSVKELIAIAKQNPGKLKIGAEPTTTQHLGSELFKLKAGVDLLFIPYKGNGPALGDLLGGQLDVMFNTVAITLPLVNAGKLRALAVAREQHSKLVPQLPTVIEAGVPEFSFVGWYGILAPAKVPKTVVIRLNGALVQVVRSPETAERMAGMGTEPVASTPEEFDKFLKDEVVKWAKLIKEAKIRADF